MLAAEAGHMDAFHILILRGSSIDEADENGKTVLHHAAEKNHVDVLRVVSFSMQNWFCYAFLLPYLLVHTEG